ncbi:MAG TPA: MlaD family protein [Ferruginibacter sp.]|jgi:phospholipid/cholesterol/gamma-HCH transport system substrate-binding protein|nr:MlaD family protein [Ferruginibacter sp.]
MTISNETKIGVLAAVAIVFLILGFNFLKGTSLGTKHTKFYAVFDNINGLANGNPVAINGKQVGTISNTDGGKDMRKITVTMSMNQELDIPNNSIAIINPSLLGTTTLEIELGNAPQFYKDGDTISTQVKAGLFDAAFSKLDPVLYQVKNAVASLDSLLGTVNSVFDERTKNNIKGTMDNLQKSSANLQILLNTQTGALAKTLDNVSSFTGGLKDNNEKINNVMTNLETTTNTLSKLDLEQTLDSLNVTINGLKHVVGKVNSDSGSIGKMINNNNLYNNLTSTSNKLNLLLDDIRVHPKRYINISLFGKKDRSTPLMVPLTDTVNSPYIKP